MSEARVQECMTRIASVMVEFTAEEAIDALGQLIDVALGQKGIPQKPICERYWDVNKNKPVYWDDNRKAWVDQPVTRREGRS